MEPTDGAAAYCAQRSMPTLLLFVLTAAGAAADGGVRFADLASDAASGITYRRIASPRSALLAPLTTGPVSLGDFLFAPAKPQGAPGVAVLDFDGDGDLDIYVTNGPGRANSLYVSQLREHRRLFFVDRALGAGVAAIDHDSTGVCYGDIDNDGDPDLYVAGIDAPGILFENRGDATFADITATAGVGGAALNANVCALADIDGDGLLDLMVGGTHPTWDDKLSTFAIPFDLNLPNKLYRNLGGNRFADAGAAAGFDVLAGLPPGVAGPTFGLAAVDYDMDGDTDIFVADDQGSFPPAANGGVDRGLLHIFANDGGGQLTDVCVEAGTAIAGSWMGFAFGDFDCNGRLDFFASNLGDPAAVFPASVRKPSVWFLGQEDGTFTLPGVGALGATPFAWGSAAVDYDNDGDSDIVFHGGLDLSPFVDASNPGVVLQNPDCTAAFRWDQAALAGSVDHLRRNVEGVAAGDLDDDGFIDIVSVSSFDFPAPLPLVPYPPVGSVFDGVAAALPTFGPLDFPLAADVTLTWQDLPLEEGTLAVEISSGDNGNRWLKVRTRGSVGLTARGRVNRDGIGAILRVTPRDRRSAMQAVLSGATFASQHALEKVFGLGDATRATVEVLWPGGVRNRLYDVRQGERLLFPEIPCSFADPASTDDEHAACVAGAVADLVAAGVLDRRTAKRFSRSALRAFAEERIAR